MNELALFAGAGGGILGGRLLGWRTRCAVEIDAYARRVLLARQRDGMLEPFPIWDNVSTFNGKPWQGAIDIVTGGFPCQDISAAGKGKGLAGERSGLWSEMARIIGEVGPQFVLVENSPLLVSRGLGRVLGDLSQMGYDAKWGVIGAHHAGAPHRRDRIWILAYAETVGFQRSIESFGGSEMPGKGIQTKFARTGCHDAGEAVVYSFGTGLEGFSGDGEIPEGRDGTDRPIGAAGICGRGWKRVVFAADCDEDGFCPGCGDDFSDCGCPGPTMDECEYREIKGVLYARPKIWFIEPGLGRVAHGVANRVDRIKCIGNGQVPAVVRLAWETLIGRI